MKFAPLAVGQLEALTQQERDASRYPWTFSMLESSLLSKADGCAIKVDNTVIGYWLVRCVLDEAELLNFVIFKPYQAKGLGLQVLIKLCAKLKQEAINTFFLEVRESNVPARNLYKKAGFTSIHRRSDYYPAGNAGNSGKENALLMRRTL